MVEVLLAAALLACDPAARPLIVAHRGGRDPGYPENTLPAFRHARDAGADVLELDLRATADGAIVVLHDTTVDRTTDGSGPVHELSLAALQRLDAGGGTRVPTLTEVLDEVAGHDIQLLLDIKAAPGLDHAGVVGAARGRGLDGIVFGVRSLADRQRLTGGAPALRLLGLVPRPEQIDAFVDAGVEGIRVWPRWLRRDPGLVQRLHARGVRVWVTAGDPADAELAWLIAQGVDALIVDRLGPVRARLGCAAGASPAANSDS